jgi:prevent-host-death family protein
VSDQNPNHRGAVSEAAITLAAIQAGLEVYRPASEHARADLIFVAGDRFFRIQCKTIHYRGAVMVVNLVSNWHSPGGYVRRAYSADEVDFVAAHDPDSGMNLLLPIGLVEGMNAISLRVSEPLNGQRAGLHYAAEYEFQGAVAQLGERVTGSDEAVGSSPISSINPEPESDVVVGAHEFREHFGWYMERAAAGETIRVTRRGKPHVQLGPATAGELRLVDAA